MDPVSSMSGFKQSSISRTINRFNEFCTLSRTSGQDRKKSRNEKKGRGLS